MTCGNNHCVIPYILVQYWRSCMRSAHPHWFLFLGSVTRQSHFLYAIEFPWMVVRRKWMLWLFRWSWVCINVTPWEGQCFALIYLKAVQFTIAPLSFCEFLFNTNDIHMLGLCSFMLSTFEYLFVFQTKDMSFFIQHCKSRLWSPSRIHVNCSPCHS